MVTAFLERPLEGVRPHLGIEATCLKVRQTGRIVPVAAIVTVGVNTDGRREVRGMDIGPPEAEPCRTAFLRKRARRACAGQSESSPTPTKGRRRRSRRS